MTQYRDVPLQTLRGDGGLARLRSLDLAQDELQDIAFDFWHADMAERIVENDFEAAWHRVQAAALGQLVFEGPRRLCRGHLEGLPVGLTCSPKGVHDLVHVLYFEMKKRGAFGEALDHFSGFVPWDFQDGSGNMIQIHPAGHRIVQILHRQHGLAALMAALMAYGIADWVSNYRRLAAAA